MHSIVSDQIKNFNYNRMQLIRLVFLVLFCCAPFFLGAQQAVSPSKIPRVLILLDGSSSMSEDWTPGNTRFQQAGKFILTLIDSLSAANDQVEFGLRVFGHQYPAQEKNCFDTKREIFFSRGNTAQMAARLQALRGYGVSPIAYSLSEAAYEDFENETKYAYSIILVTDGGESCDGDICKVVNDLLQRKIFFRPYIVSLLDYAPLRDLYKCLGTFLTVSKESEMAPVASKITDAHREGFDRAKTGKVISVLPEYKKPDTIVKKVIINRPEVVVPEVETPKPKDSVKPNPAPVAVVSKPKEGPKKEEPPVAPKPAAPLQERDRRVFVPLRLKTKMKVFKTIIIDPPYPKIQVVPPFKMSTVGDAPKVDTMAAVKPLEPIQRIPYKIYPPLKLAKKKSFGPSLVVLPNPKKLIVPPFQQSKFEPQVAIVPDTLNIPITVIKRNDAPPIAKPVVKQSGAGITVVSKPTTQKKEATPFDIKKEPSVETEVELYFTDGNGKFYSTTPQILLSDPVTGKEVHTFYRTVNPEGNPDPAKVPSGSFNLSVVGSDRTYLKGVEISPNMKNKIIVTVASGSLQFVWKTGDSKKPVDKYFAQVKRNFVPQPMVTQKCDTVLSYPPGNYHIEINTMPVSVRSVDLNFGSVVVIPIDVPGTIQFTNSQNLGKVKLYYPLGDRYVQFWQMDIRGNAAAQSLELKPGPYEVHYSLAPGLPEKVFKFQIKSNETTLAELN